MGRLAYYERMKLLAREKRAQHGTVTAHFGLREIRAIYKQEGITVDLWKLPATIRAVYMCDGDDPSVLVNRGLPTEPRLFAMVHELKHHYVDRSIIERGGMRCGDYNANQMLEIGAEVFAAEFIYPEAEFRDCLNQLGIAAAEWTPETVVLLKRSCGARVSYRFLQKRLERHGIIPRNAFAGVQFQKLEEEIYGPPIYKQEWFKAARARKYGKN